MDQGTEGGRAMEIIGHRGSPHLAPENTLVSVKRAWAEKADTVEIDIHLTKDRSIVVIHDPTTARTAGADLKVSESTADELRQLDFGSLKGEEFVGERIPFLEEVIATLPPHGRLLVEIKSGQEILPVLKETIEASGRAQQVVLIGFDLETMTEAKRMMPDLPAYWLRFSGRDQSTGEYLPYPHDLIDTALERNLDGLDLHYGGITAEFAADVRAAGLKLYAWTVNDPAEAARLIALGVDAIATDRPGWLREQLT